MMSIQGTVDWYDPDRVYGFIKPRWRPAPGSCAERLSADRKRLFDTIERQGAALESMAENIQKVESEMEALRQAYKTVQEDIGELSPWIGFNAVLAARHNDEDVRH
jgi:DNA repair exonuclease SbcCD ATPase subunit